MNWIAVVFLFVLTVAIGRRKLKHAMLELEKNSDQLAAILKGINDGITVVDENDRYVFVNEIGARTCGFSSVEEMMKVKPSWVLNQFEIMDENGLPFPQEKLPASLVLQGETSPSEVIVRFRQKGKEEERWSIVKASPIVSKSDHSRMAVSVFKDFTERKKLEDSIKQAHRQMEALALAAETANKIKSLFLANMSHEIRTPLGAILGFNCLMSDPKITQQERRRYTEIIDRNGHQLTQLIDDILDLSKVEAGHLEVEVLEIALPSLITDITTMLNPKAKEKGLNFYVSSDGRMPEFVYSDPTRLRQILINIIGNAIKFTQKGSVKVTVKAEPSATDNQEKLIIHIEDTGEGIPQENQCRLFDWFTQAEACTTRKFGGTGLGLALSRKLARALGGDLVLTKSNSSGSIFTVSIANQSSKYKKISIQENKEAITSYTNNAKQEDLNGVRVLLVEDSADNRTLIECILGQRGAHIESAENGLEGVEKALKSEFDLVLMDIQMPLFNGIQATSELRKRGYRKPIVALTAHAMKEEREETIANGCDAHLTKPIEISKLLNIVAELGHQHH